MNSEIPPTNDSPPSLRKKLEADVTCDYTSDPNAEALVRILDRYLEDLKAGRGPSRDALLASHPELASQLEACLAGLEFIHQAEHSLPERKQRLGDFRIGREIGRGGMGAVFEAEQVSLGRRVAIKVLRFGGVSDPAALERFQREAETVAKLHHTNIVPIFAVGNENGVNYYAMQFIDGQSLAEVLGKHGGPLPAEQVADWGLQAAEALAHAHQRGVIHRDVKPSNLLLDHENRVWLTDFGLARRLDDVTLSMTGALLGTPRYMSPEQAGASVKRVDHRSDLFSLGATLYELLSSRPAFTGENAHEVIQRILKEEPTPLRSIEPGIPRDLETIVMKCLSKDPQHRYNAARDLADDLRAFLDGRPIRARRASAVELAARWIKQHQRNVVLAVSAAAITLLLTLAINLGLAKYDAWQLATLQLDAVNPPLVAEIFDRKSELKRIDTLPMQKSISLPADDYELRISGEGELSQTYSVSLERGHGFNATVNLEDPYLLPLLVIERAFDVMDLGNESGIVLWTEQGVALRKKSGPALGWDIKLGPELTSFESAPGFRWPWSNASMQHSGYGSYKYQPWVVSSKLDINLDGVGDLVAAGRHQAWMMAISGADGNPLWIAPRGEQVLQTPRDEPFPRANDYRSAVLNEPMLSPDLDGDGIEELIATMIDVPADASSQGIMYPCKRWIEALSARSGKTVWRYDISDHLFELASGEEVPYDMRWFVGGSGGSTSGGRGSMSAGKHIVRDRPQQERTGIHVYPSTSATSVTLSGESRLAFLAGKHLVILDPQTGKEWEPPIDLGVRCGNEPQWADVDGDGSSDLIFLEEIASSTFPRIPTAKLHVWSHARRKMLWSLALDAYWPQRQGWTVDAPRWPVIVDLHGDGKCEILVPHGSSKNAKAPRTVGVNATPWGALVAFEGGTGREIWNHKIVSMDMQVDSFIDGPDLDGDGVREVFAVTLASNNFTIYVDALSGATGTPCWTGSFVPRNTRGLNSSFVLGPPKWWHRGPDGWPQLLVPLVDEQGSTRQSLYCAFSAGTGQVTHHGYGWTSARTADLDRDGLEELLLYTSKSPDRCDFGGELKCLRGIGRQPWKRLGPPSTPTDDLDGDGIRDLIRSLGDGTLHATSGATGRPLWQSRPIPATDELGIQKVSELHDSSVRDLNGDGCADLLVWEPSSGGRGSVPPLHAISGQTGKLIWSISDVRARMTHTLAILRRDLNSDGQIEIVWLAALDHAYPPRFAFSSNDSQLWIFVVSGETGKLLWSQALSPAYGHSVGTASPYQFQRVDLAISTGDLNGDGHQDVLVPAIEETGQLALKALDSSDGRVLWKRIQHPDGFKQESLRNWTPPTVCDMDGDGKIEVACVEPSPMTNTNGANTQEAQVAMLEGSSGRARWIQGTRSSFSRFYAISNRRKGISRPVVLRTGSGQQKIAVYLPGGDDKFIVFDAQGNRTERHLRYQPQPIGLWACDVHGDGVDEIVFVDDSSLHVVAIDQSDESLWSRKFGSIGQQDILEILPQGPKNSPVIVFGMDPTDNSVLGIDAATGRTLWSSPGPITRDAAGEVYMVPKERALLGQRPGAPPLICYAFGSVSECRQAVPRVDTSSERIGTESDFKSMGIAPVNRQASLSDNRWLRELPWKTQFDSAGERLTEFALWGMTFAATMVVLPFGYMTYLISRRQFGLRSFLGLPIVVGVLFLASVLPAPADNDFRTTLSRWMVGIGFTPPLLGICLLAYWWIKGLRWRTSFWIGMILLLSILIATLQFAASFRNAPLLPEESIDWTGWHTILWVGAYATSWILVSVLGLEWLARLIRGRLSRLRTSNVR